MRSSLATFAAASLLGVGLCWLGCGSDDRGTHLGTTPTTTGSTTNTSPTDCSRPAQGCPCPVPGSSGECKKLRKSGDYISCSTGTITCGDDKKWGECIGDSIWDPDAAVLDAADAADSPDALDSPASD